MNMEKLPSRNGAQSAEIVVADALINKKTGEVVEVGERTTPSEIVARASEAAKVLEDVITQNKKKPVEFNGKRHLEIAHWQTIAKFFHCTPGTEDAEPVEVHGVKGFRASAHVIDERTNQRVGSAVAYCMQDEPNWKAKPLFQLASMAQTRAASKALSNKYRYVAILAGYDPTPAEEIDDTPVRAPIATPQAVDAAVVTDEKDRALSLDERSKIINNVKAAGLIAPFKKFMADTLHAEHSSKLLLSHVPTIDKWLSVNASDI